MIISTPLEILRKTAKRPGLTWLPVVCGLFILGVILLIIRTKRDTDDHLHWIDHTYQVMKTLDGMQLDVALSPDHAPHLDEKLQQFQYLTRDNTSQVARLRILRQQIDEARRLDSPLARYTGIRDILQSMMNEESRLLQHRQLALDKTRNLSRIVLYCCLLVLFLALIYLLRKLLASESRHRNLIDNVSAVIYSTDLDGRIQYASPGVLSLTGYTAEELHGKRYTILVDPAGLPVVKKYYEQQFRENVRETTFQFRTVTRQGEQKWVEQTAILLKKDGRPAGFQCIVRDITANKKMKEELEVYERKLKENQALLQSILDNTSSLIYVKSPDGRYRIVNRRFLEVMGFSEEQVINHTDFDLCEKEKAQEYHTVDEIVMQTGQPVDIEEQLLSVNGPLHLLLTKFPLKDNAGHVVGVSGIATDITERVHYQQQLIASRTEAEEARQMQERFLANMSHEIRTPMNGIQGMTNLLLETKLSPQQEEFAAIISRSVDSLLVIINDILDLSRIKANKLSIERINFRLMDVLTNVRSLFDHRIQKKHLLFEWNIDPSIPEWLQGDPHRLNQVLINLVGNAIKFTEKGAIRLGVSIADRQTPGQLTVSFDVADTGIGIPAASLPHIFESFSQAGTDISRRYGGTGLGLAICHQLLQMQGGSITVSSAEGKGSTFTCTLTFGCEPVDNAPRQVAHSLKDFDGCFKDRRFLVVEDNPVNQKLMEYVLRKTGAAISVADNGEEALGILRTEEFDLIVMDLQMPGIDGYETTRRLRNDLRMKTPVMAMTANAITGERIRCLEAGMNDYMSKPFDFREFYTRVAGLLHTSQTLPASQGCAAGGNKSYSLSLLEEIGDEEYLQDILQTFLINLPEQVSELQASCASGDHDRIFFIAHKLKGTCGMLQAAALVEKLALVQQLAKERSDASTAVDEIAALVDALLPCLEQEKHRHIIITSSSNNI